MAHRPRLCRAISFILFSSVFNVARIIWMIILWSIYLQFSLSLEVFSHLLRRVYSHFLAYFFWLHHFFSHCHYASQVFIPLALSLSVSLSFCSSPRLIDFWKIIHQKLIHRSFGFAALVWIILILCIFHSICSISEDNHIIVWIRLKVEHQQTKNEPKMKGGRSRASTILHTPNSWIILFQPECMAYCTVDLSVKGYAAWHK